MQRLWITIYNNNQEAKPRPSGSGRWKGGVEGEGPFQTSDDDDGLSTYRQERCCFCCWLWGLLLLLLVMPFGTMRLCRFCTAVFAICLSSPTKAGINFHLFLGSSLFSALISIRSRQFSLGHQQLSTRQLCK